MVSESFDRVQVYGPDDPLPEWISLEPDVTTCQIRVTCGTDRPALIGWHLVEDGAGREVGEWREVCALRADPSEETPVLACEDCVAWLEDVFGPEPPAATS